MWTCPKCKMTNDTYICTSCGFDASRDYRHHRFLCQLSGSASKISKPKVSDGLFGSIFDLFGEKNILRDNVLMASSDTDYIFGRKMDRKEIKNIYFRNKKENIGEDAWDVSEKQNGSVIAWTEKKEDGLLDLYIAADGNIMANKDASNMFCKYTQLKNISGLEFLQTGRVKDMSHMFGFCENLISLDVSHFDTSQVTNMSGMFIDCYRLESLDLSHFNTSQVTDMSYMFSMAENLFFSHWEGNCLKNLDVSHFDTSRVRNMESMFVDCHNLVNLDVSHFDTSQVRSMRSMFADCHNLVNLDVSHFDTSRVEDMSRMFDGCEGVENLDVSHFDTSHVTDMFRMFSWCNNLKSLNMSHFDTSHVINMNFMFENCESLESLDISGFSTNSVKDFSDPLPKYLGVPQEVHLKTKKSSGFFSELWGD